MKAVQRKAPLEVWEQNRVFEWADRVGLDSIFHIPNEAKRNPRTGAILRTAGLKKGVPDIFLPIAAGTYHGMFIEMKRVKGSRVSDEQMEWISKLTEQGYKCVIAYGHEQAINYISEYLGWRDANG